MAATVEKWILYSIISLLLWGIWGVLLKQASEIANWKQLYFYSGTATLAVMAAIIAISPQTLTRISKTGALLAVASGASGALGYIALVKALETGGKASIVIPLTALYPAVTAILAWLLLGEKMGLEKIIGLLLALIAIILLTK